jgi:transcription antitermination factor NusG
MVGPGGTEKSSWYAFRIKSRHENLVRDQLECKGFQPLLPTIKRLRQWKGRRKEVEVPIFSGYCFARFHLGQKLSVVKTSGVVEMVGNGYHPEPIPDEEINSLRTLLSRDSNCQAHPFLRDGMAIQVIRGPLEGVRGILLRKTSRHKLVVGINLIHKAVSLEIDAIDVEPL